MLVSPCLWLADRLAPSEPADPTSSSLLERRMRSDAIKCIVGTMFIPPLIGTETAVITRYFATPLRSGSAIADVDPDVIGQNHVKQGDPLLELSNGQILCAPCDGDLDWCMPVGYKVSEGTPLGEFMEEPELSSRTILVQIRLPSWPHRRRANNLAAQAKLSRWFTKVGDKVRRGDPVAEFITDEGQIVVVYAPADGVIAEKGTPPSCRDYRTASDTIVKLRVTLPAPESRVVLGRDLDTDRRVTVTPEQLCSGCYILGVQGVGKSSLLEQIACQLLDQDESVIVFDPHGQLIDNIVARMPSRRLQDTFHLDLKDRDYPFGLNVFACADPDDEEERDRTRNQVTHAFEKLWPETRSGVYFKKLLRHVIILLIEHPQLTLADVPRLLREQDFRTQFTQRLRNTGSRSFWRYDYGALSPARQLTESGPLLTRVDELLAEPVITRVLCQPQSTMSIRSIIEQRQNLLIRLPINEDAYAKAAGLVGTMLMAMVYAATFSFADVPEEKRPGFTLIVDEFQNFATDEYAQLFAQGRKFKARQFLAHQFRDQLADAGMEANKAATLTAQTKVIFKVTKADAQVLADDFLPLAQQRQTLNLDLTPAGSLDRHPSPVVKEFAKRYVWPLEEGTADTIRRGRVDTGQRRSRPEYFSIEPQRDFGAGKRSFNPDDAEQALALLNEVLYKGQKERRLDDETVAELLDAMKPLLGRSPETVEVWDSPAHEAEYEELGNKLSRLEACRPANSISMPDTFYTLVYSYGTPAIHEQKRRIYRDRIEPIHVNLAAYEEKIALLCLPSVTWANDQPEHSWTRADRPSGERTPYVFTGSPVTMIDAPLLNEYEDQLSDDMRADAPRMIADWLRSQVFWWRQSPKTWRRGNNTPDFERVTYTKGPGSVPYEWMRRLVEKEAALAQKKQKELAEFWRDWEEMFAELGERRKYAFETYHRWEETGQPELQRLRRDLEHVLPALLGDPVTVNQNKVTSKDVAQSLQHLARRQAYVRIGTAAYAMKTRELEKRVSADEEQRRFQQLQDQTRRALCRHVAELDATAAHVQDVPDLSEIPSPAKQPDPERPARTATDSGGSEQTKTSRIRRFRPLP